MRSGRRIRPDPRGVAQSGSAPGWGPGGRRFKSCLPDWSPVRATKGPTGPAGDRPARHHWDVDVGAALIASVLRGRDNGAGSHARSHAVGRD